MASQPPPALGGATRLGRVLAPSLDKILKNVAWRKHSHLVSAAKSALDLLQTLATTPSALPSSLLAPLLLALLSSSPKLILPSLDSLFRLFSLNLLPLSSTSTTSSEEFRLLNSVCDAASSADEGVQFAAMRTILAAVRSPAAVFSGEFLNHIVKTCYNVYLGGVNGTNQICAKAVLAQIVLIVFARVEEDSVVVNGGFKVVSVLDLLEFTDRNLSEGNSAQLVQNLINEVMEGNDDVVEVEEKGGEINGEAKNKNKEKEKEKEKEEEMEEEGGSGESRLREDGFVLFKNLCKLSMKFSSQDHSDDQILLRGKILSLELLKVVMDNGGPVWRTNDR